jgi:ADP-ribosylglycohydrolase
MTHLTADTRYRLARLSLDGLSVGDAFGQQFFAPEDEATARILARELPDAPWPITDDTLMTASVCEVLARFGRIDQDALAESFWRRCQPERGYGASMRRLLARLADGADWRTAAAEQFSGMGSHGNGAAMRVSPVGAYFFDDLERVTDEAVRSAVVTHTHPDGVAGAVAVAVASAMACRIGHGVEVASHAQFLERVATLTPAGAVRQGIEVASRLPPNASVRLAVSALGSGIGLSATDTVPFALWAAARHLAEYETALWETVSGLGDRDTTCAIVGGIVVLSTKPDRFPPDWLSFRETLPDWLPQATSNTAG